MPNTEFKRILETNITDNTEYDRIGHPMMSGVAQKPIRSWQDLDMVPSTATLNKMTAGIFALLLGSYGCHKFYMGDVKNGLIRLAAMVLTVGAGALIVFPLSIYEAVRYFKMDSRQFYWDYDTRDGLYGRDEPKHWG